MRDHPAHKVTILGGMWGAKLAKEETRKKLNDTWTLAFNQTLVWQPRNIYNLDQVFLDRCIFLTVIYAHKKLLNIILSLS